MITVHIELKRVQSWLFSTPRLRAMVGANTQLGEVLREGLRALLEAGAAGDHPRWKLAKPQAASEFPPADPGDPLHAVDDPRTDALRGILSRDGGHFEACFESGAGAEAFAQEAAALLRQDLPQMGFSVKVLEDSQRHDAPSEPHPALGSEDRRFLSLDLPVLVPCSWAGRGVASFVAGQGDDLDEVSLEAAHRHAVAKRAEDGKAQDLVTLLMRECSPGRRAADTFEEVADGGYLAVIHADGNNVGSALPLTATPAQRAKLHHRNRVLIRQALGHAIKESHNTAPSKDRRTHPGRRPVSPVLPLMLGGDDLLMICRADIALRLVADLCHELDRLQTDVPADQFRLTLGIGVAIASYALPFHQFHQVTEALTSSAKRKVRTMANGERVSVVDWAVYTASWADKDLATVRRREWICGAEGKRRLLSQRPLTVLDGKSTSLESLLRGAEQLEKAPRSQLRYLVDQLSQGEQLAELAFRELSPAARQALDRVPVTNVWSDEDTGARTTELHDLVEVLEIRRLGRKPPHEAPATTGDVQ